MEPTRVPAAGCRRDPVVARIVHGWRRLTTPVGADGHPARRAGPGARTVIACSGGADSSALALALGTASGDLVIAHVVHDLRPAAESGVDRDAARALAGRLSLPFAEAAVRVRGGAGEWGGGLPGAVPNAEAGARRLRYAALAGIARERGAGFVATGHHAGDQAESVLMGLLRGAGPRGMSGMAPSRAIGPGVTLIRPMLGVTHGEAVRLCAAAGWTPCEDRTNGDTTRLRAALRHGVLPALRRLRPGLDGRLAGSVRLLRDAAAMMDEAAQGLLAGGKIERDEDGPWSVSWARATLRPLRPTLIGEALRGAARAVAGAEGADGRGLGRVWPAAGAVRDGSGEARVFGIGGAEVLVTGGAVEVRRKGLHRWATRASDR